MFAPLKAAVGSNYRRCAELVRRYTGNYKQTAKSDVIALADISQFHGCLGDIHSAEVGGEIRMTGPIRIKLSGRFREVQSEKQISAFLHMPKCRTAV